MRSREASPAVVPSANPTLSLKSLSNVPQFIVPPFRDDVAQNRFFDLIPPIAIIDSNNNNNASNLIYPLIS